MIDPSHYYRENGSETKASEWENGCGPSAATSSSHNLKIDPKESDPTPDHCMLTPSFIRGFTLDARDQRVWS